MVEGKQLICQAVSLDKFRCKLGDTEWSVPMENTLFDLTSINNLKSVKFKGKAKFRLYASEVDITADDNSTIFCNYNKNEDKLYCKAIGSHDSPYPDDYDTILMIPHFREPESPKEQDLLNDLFQNSLSRFSTIKDEIGFMKPLISSELDKHGVYAMTYFSLQNGHFKPITIFISSKSLYRALQSDEGKDLLLTDIDHELTHVYRSLSGEAKQNMAEDEAETYAEELLIDLDIRRELDVPSGIPEEATLSTNCILPYCFTDIEEVHEFEEKNYEIMTGNEEWQLVQPNTPEWEEAAKRAPVTPIADIVRVYYKGYHRDGGDVDEYWVVVQSPTGKKYAYHLTDLHVDHHDLDYIDVIETIDELNITKGEDIELIKDIS